MLDSQGGLNMITDRTLGKIQGEFAPSGIHRPTDRSSTVHRIDHKRSTHNTTISLQSTVPSLGGSTVAASASEVGGRSFSLMATLKHLEISEVGDVTVVRFLDRKILDETSIQELGQELFQLIEVDDRKKLLLNFSSVEFLSSAALGKLITLERKAKSHAGVLKLCHIRPEIYEVFAITKLNKLFDIKEDEADALAAF